MVLDLILVTAGIVALVGSAALVVRSASRLALMFGLSPIFVGATIVAFGTSAPEFVVSFVAGARDSSGLAVGNVLGSNVANAALVLGLAAMINPMRVHARLVRWEIPVLAGATAAVLLLGGDGHIDVLEGLLMFLGLVGFVAISPVLFPEVGAEAAAESQLDDIVARSPRTIGADVTMLVIGLAGLALGANVTVEGATGIAERIGLSDVVIGVTIVAVGTSLPEVATSVVAAYRNEHDIAVANVVGSNIFNLLGVLGLTSGLVGLDIDRSLFEFEMWALVASTAVLVPLAWLRRVTRYDGLLLLLLYAAFVVLILQRA